MPEIKKENRVRSDAHLKWLKLHTCLVCRRPAAHAHHVVDGRHSLGMKAGDDHAVPLCWQHHGDLHNHKKGEHGFWLGYAIDVEDEIARLNAASPYLKDQTPEKKDT